MDMNSKPYSEQHRLSSIDLGALTAVCLVCGPVEVAPHRRKKHLVQCANGQANEIAQERAYNGQRYGDDAFKAKKRQDYHDKHWKRALEKRYNLPIGWYDDTLAKQDGKCRICREVRPNEWGKYCIDHCHNTGAARGLLCGFCNSMIGYAREREDILLAAVEYLRAFAC